MFHVKLINAGYTWYLKSTTWTGTTERADKFETEEAAKAALLKAKPFMKAKLFKLCEVVPA